MDNDSYPNSDEDYDLTIDDILKKLYSARDSNELKMFNAELEVFLTNMKGICHLEYWVNVDFTGWTALNVRLLQERILIGNKNCDGFDKYLQTLIKNKTDCPPQFVKLNVANSDTEKSNGTSAKLPLPSYSWWNRVAQSRSTKYIGGAVVTCLGLVYLWNVASTSNSNAS